MEDDALVAIDQRDQRVADKNAKSYHYLYCVCYSINNDIILNRYGEDT